MSRFGISKKLFKFATATVLSFATFQVASSAQASTFTLTSPTAGGTLPNGISPVGGIVIDIIGQNDARVTSQLAASNLFVGYFNTGTPIAYRGNPGTIGIESGFTPAITGALGGGLKEVAVRFSLFDGDTASGNFDYNNNTLLLNGINFGNWSSVNAQNTNSQGIVGSAGFSGGGFRNNLLDTGWFYVNDSSTLSNFFTTLVNTQQVVYQLQDQVPYNNYLDFTRGVSASFASVDLPPAVQPATQPVPEPLTIFGSLTAAGFGAALRRKQKQQQKATAKA